MIYLTVKELQNQTNLKMLWYENTKLLGMIFYTDQLKPFVDKLLAGGGGKIAVPTGFQG